MCAIDDISNGSSESDHEAIKHNNPTPSTKTLAGTANPKNKNGSNISGGGVAQSYEEILNSSSDDKIEERVFKHPRTYTEAEYLNRKDGMYIDIEYMYTVHSYINAL